MYLNPGNFNQLEKLIELRPYVLNMGKGPFGTHIPFTAEQFISIHGEIIVEGRFLLFHLRNKRRQDGLHLILLALMDLEIRVYADDIPVFGHTLRFGASLP